MLLTLSFPAEKKSLCIICLKKKLVFCSWPFHRYSIWLNKSFVRPFYLPTLKSLCYAARNACNGEMSQGESSLQLRQGLSDHTAPKKSRDTGTLTKPHHLNTWHELHQQTLNILPTWDKPSMKGKMELKILLLLSTPVKWTRCHSRPPRGTRKCTNIAKRQIHINLQRVFPKLT